VWEIVNEPAPADLLSDQVRDELRDYHERQFASIPAYLRALVRPEPG
jgi:hypothetical protein